MLGTARMYGSAGDVRQSGTCLQSLQLEQQAPAAASCCLQRWPLPLPLHPFLFNPCHSSPSPPLPSRSIRDEVAVKRAVSRSNVVINCVGAEQETWNYGFEEVHIEWPARLARAVKEAGRAQRVIHVRWVWLCLGGCAVLWCGGLLRCGGVCNGRQDSGSRPADPGVCWGHLCTGQLLRRPCSCHHRFQHQHQQAAPHCMALVLRPPPTHACCHPCGHPAPRSCLGADAGAPSRRLRTKAAGEEVVRSELGPLATIFRPAVMTGTEDRLFNTYATMAKRLPFFPLIDGGATRMQPVWVRDVSAAIINSLKTYEALGQTYTLAGPDVMTVAQQVRMHAGRPGRLGLAGLAWLVPGLGALTGGSQTGGCAATPLTAHQPLNNPCPPSPPSFPPQVAFMYATIRERNAALPIPSLAAAALAKAWQWVGTRSPLRGPTMFSPDYVAEMKVGAAGWLGYSCVVQALLCGQTRWVHLPPCRSTTPSHRPATCALTPAGRLRDAHRCAGL